MYGPEGLTSLMIHHNMVCYPDLIVGDLRNVKGVENKLRVLSEALGNSNRTSLCDLPFWHSSNEVDVYKAFQDVAYLNYNASISLFQSECLSLLLYIPLCYAAFLSFRFNGTLSRKAILEACIVLFPACGVILGVIPPIGPVVVTACIILFNTPRTCFPRECSQHANGFVRSINGSHVVYLSLFRSIMALCILFGIMAVDFSIFPRVRAKSETFGISTMDIGVGTVLFSAGLVRRRRGSLSHQLLKLIPVIFFGLVRLLSVWSVSYHVSVSEYGTHWNFFFTIALSTVISEILFGLGITPLATCVILPIAYQSLLTSTGMTTWVFSAPRNNFLSANREGVLSCIGFASLYSAGSTLAVFLQRFHRHPFRLLLLLMTCAVFGGMLESLCVFFFSWYPSRRLANLPYCIDIVSLCCMVLALSLIMDVVGACVGIEWNQSNSFPMLPILSGLHRNQLSTFLIANLLIGALNLSIRTLILSPFWAIMCFLVYVALFSTVSTFLSKSSLQSEVERAGGKKE